IVRSLEFRRVLFRSANKKLVAEWQILYDRLLKKASLKNQLARLDRQFYRITGDFFLDSDPHFDLDIKTTNLSVKEAASIFPPQSAKRINSYELSKPLQQVHAVLSG